MWRSDLHGGAEKGVSMLLKRVVGPAIGTVLVVLFFSGCVSRPDPAVQNYASLLYEEQGIFLQIRPNENLTLAEKMLSTVGMDAESMQTVLERTHTAYCFFEFDTSGFTYTIIGEGRYPETIAALSLRRNSEWVRREDEAGSMSSVSSSGSASNATGRKEAPLRWWHNLASGVQLSFFFFFFLCITNGDIRWKLKRIYYGPVVPLPEKAAEMLASGVLGIYSRNPDLGGAGNGGAKLSGTGFSAAGAPVSRFFERLDTISMNFQSSTEQSDLFTIDAEYVCDDERVARSLFLVMRLALLSGLRSLEGEYNYSQLTDEDPVSLQQNRVLLQGYPISLENIDWFFQQAMPYVRIEE